MRSAFAYAYLGDHTGLALTHRGHKILLDTRDLAFSPHIVHSGEWERAVEEVVLRHAKQNSIVIEVGCNHGYHTLSMANAIGPNGRLYGFEANPEIFRLLRWSIDLNGFTSRVTLHNKAAADKAGLSSFCFEPEAIGGGHLGDDGSSTSRQYTVQMTSLDEALSTVPHVDLLRMDAEGSEGMILVGATRLIERSPRLTIITEWCPQFLRARGTNPEDAIAFLADRKFRAHRINHDAKLIPVEKSELANLPHCELVLAR
jgi:FkbM family methyltransferase